MTKSMAPARIASTRTSSLTLLETRMNGRSSRLCLAMRNASSPPNPGIT